jgi:hypothetical protein
MARLQIRRGAHANLPAANLLAGEPLVTMDRGNLHVALDDTTKIAVTPAIDLLSTLAAIDPAGDLLILHDASEVAAQREKKITFGAFKAALNIPAGSTDEKVAAVSGGTAGYLAGTDGTDGILRVDASLTLTIDASTGFARLGVAVIDGGTF